MPATPQDCCGQSIEHVTKHEEAWRMNEMSNNRAEDNLVGKEHRQSQRVKECLAPCDNRHNKIEDDMASRH